MGITMNVAAILSLIVVVGAVVRTTEAMVFTSRISLHFDAACPLFAEEVADEGGQCNHDVIEEVMDEADEIEAPGIDGERIEDYLEEAEKGKMCYSPDGEEVTKLKDGCSAMEAVCQEGANVMYCREMKKATNAQ